MLHFNLDNFHNRVRRDWAFQANKTISCVATWKAAAKRHTKKHGAAGVWNCDDSFILFYRDGDKIRSKTWRHASPN